MQVIAQLPHQTPAQLALQMPAKSPVRLKLIFHELFIFYVLLDNNFSIPFANINKVKSKTTSTEICKYKLYIFRKILLVRLSDHLDTTCYCDSLCLFTVGYLTIRKVILHKFAQNMCKFTYLQIFLK